MDDESITGTSHTVDGLQCATEYQFPLSAFGDGTTYGAAWSDASESETATTGTCVPPVFSQTSYNFSVMEDAAVGTVTATDASGEPVTYAITAGNEEEKFAIDAETGAITVAGALSGDTGTTATLTVEARDAAGGTAEVAVTVRVTPTCGSGTAGANPGANPELVADCKKLLGLQSALAGEAALNWSADLAMGDWDGLRLGGAPHRGPGGRCATPQGGSLRGCSFSWQGCGTWGWGEPHAAQLTTTHAMWVWKHGRSHCARDGGRRRSQGISSSRTAAGVSNRGCGDTATYRASTLGQGASQCGPKRRQDNDLCCQAFPAYSRPETWEEVPASGTARGIEPCSPDGGSSGTSAGPAARGGRGVEPLLPRRPASQRREDSDGHAADRVGLRQGTMTDPHHGGSGWSRPRRPALNAVGCRRHAIVAARVARHSGDARTHPRRWDGMPRRLPAHSRA